ALVRALERTWSGLLLKALWLPLPAAPCSSSGSSSPPSPGKQQLLSGFYSPETPPPFYPDTRSSSTDTRRSDTNRTTDPAEGLVLRRTQLLVRETPVFPGLNPVDGASAATRRICEDLTVFSAWKTARFAGRTKRRRWPA
ncbi:hypothetical protein KUCAC02_033374, partial [Chaenocephalus aceratus]